ncbi:hypothetical protein [Ralstonia chuxiongensis]|uniref:Uncharacterized protein n=1 Tax=Ralstonia chuxiongensis TaxID=2957504 RepID=A0AA41WU47_9RALS|nr:hypothetical protein [Ralstonia chuxiongensis]MCP1171605.1 hypothetical protein [Ralstonia chuxiongensis]
MPTTMAGLPSLDAHERRVMLTEVFLMNQIDTKALIGIFFQKNQFTAIAAAVFRGGRTFFVWLTWR